jgi:4a-hydroxytetrahydrobiopterin dehydratase
MKPSSVPRKSSRVTVRNATLLNLFATPGLGSLLAGRRLAGAGQLLVFLTGFCLYLAYFMRVLSSYYQLMFLDAPPAEASAISRSPWPGVWLCAAAWVWSLQTCISLRRANERSRREALAMFGAGSQPLDEAGIHNALGTLPEWQRNGEQIACTFAFKDFPAAMKFVNEVAGVAERVQHHPDVDIRWNKVTLALTTHDAGGLTDKDFALARACEALAKL